MKSLRARAIGGGLAWTVFAVVLGGLALLSIFDSLATRRFDATLEERHLQAVVALGNAGGDAERIEELLPDPAYDRPYSGRYWQMNGPDGTLLTSRSLFDFSFPDDGVPTTAEIWTGDGPEGPVRGLRQRITLEDGQAWDVFVAESVATLVSERQEIITYGMAAFAFFCLAGMVGATVLTSAVLRPLTQLRSDVAHRWDRGAALEPSDYPTEVSPLVADINTLLARNREVVDRGRRQSADLAHALKTPAAVLRNALEALPPDREGTAAALEALNRIDAQISRSLARMRANPALGVVRPHSDVARSVDRMLRLFRATPTERPIRFESTLAPDLAVSVDAQDLEEMLGNLLENALKFGRSTISITATHAAENALITVEDDGPGIPEADRRRALSAGGRLDTATPGTGLGLAIVGDLAAAYGGALDLSTSPRLGGLMISITLPR